MTIKEWKKLARKHRTDLERARIYWKEHTHTILKNKEKMNDKQV